jgi:hypothetical protein
MLILPIWSNRGLLLRKWINKNLDMEKSMKPKSLRHVSNYISVSGILRPLGLTEDIRKFNSS